ncbi:MAG: DUF6526 family protein [Algoriphagus sp.]|nr:DUF6526 family protein [Algoriphagus sp.]
MKTQNFKNHARYYPLHHFIVTPLTLIFLGWTVNRSNFETSESTSESIYFLILALIVVILPMMERIYALKNQNRIILTEMRQRYFHLTGKSFYEKERDLRTIQIIALRFAGDDELLELIDQAISKKLSNKEIKMTVKNWKPDFSRV